MTTKTNQAQQALPHENVIFKCWKPDCRKVATCRDGKGWEWCDDHVNQEKVGGALHSPQEFFDVDFYTENVKKAIALAVEKERERILSLLPPKDTGFNLCLERVYQALSPHSDT